MSRPTAVLFCPGRGSYGREELGFLNRHLQDGPVAKILQAQAAEILELDAAPSFRPSQHLDGLHAAGLIYFGTLLQLQHLQQRYRIVAVAGNSLGWYSALVAAEALSVQDGWQLVTTLAKLQKQIPGGQILTTCVDEQWREDPQARRQLEQAMAQTLAQGAEYFVAPSIHLGGHEVVAGNPKGLQYLLGLLPKRQVGQRTFPFQLAGHGPFHSKLCTSTAVASQKQLAELAMQQPQLQLIDGLGGIHSPWSGSPKALLKYTLQQQLVKTFDFSQSVRCAIREFNPEVLLCAGPGQSLRAPVGHVVLREGYRGIRSKEDLFQADLIRMD